MPLPHDTPGRHPNAAKMEAAVQRWIDEATLHPDAARLLNAKAERMNEWIYALAAEGETPAHLVGLTVFDLANARDRLSAAALSAQERRAVA